MLPSNQLKFHFFSIFPGWRSGNFARGSENIPIACGKSGTWIIFKENRVTLFIRLCILWLHCCHLRSQSSRLTGRNRSRTSSMSNERSRPRTRVRRPICWSEGILNHAISGFFNSQLPDTMGS